MKAFVVGSVLLLASVCSGSYIPADTPEVAAAKAAHFAAHAHAGHSAGPAHHGGHWDHHEHVEKWHGPIHVPVIHKGVPVETPEVQHAKAAHAAAYAKIDGGYGGAYHGAEEHHQHHHAAPAASAYHHHEGGAWHGPQHIPVIHNGVPVETPEVQHAKQFHLNALHNAGAGSHHWAAAPAHHESHYEDDGSYKPELYEKNDY